MQSTTPKRTVPITFAASDVFDSGSPMYSYIKVPSVVTSITQCIVSLAFRQFFAPATAAASGGGSTSGDSTVSVGVSSEGHVHSISGSTGAATAGTAHTHPAGTYLGVLTSVPDPAIISLTDHHHTTPAHTHGLTYGTFEEALPASWSVKLRVYKRSGGLWVLQYTSPAQTTDLVDIDLSAVITTAGDWRLTVLSDAATPNGGRLSCDLYGSITAQIG